MLDTQTKLSYNICYFCNQTASVSEQILTEKYIVNVNKVVMSKDKSEQHQEIDWDALEAEDKANEVSNEEEVDVDKIEEEKKLLSKEEKFSPYPDDFLADINIIRKEYDQEQKNNDFQENDLEE